MINKKYITQLPLVNNPNLTGFTVYDDGLVTYKIDLNSLSDVINSKDNATITGVTFSENSLIFQYNNGDQITTEIKNFDQVNANIISAISFYGNVYGDIISGGTLYGDGSNLTGIQDIRIVKGDYDPLNNLIAFTNNLNETFYVTGITNNQKYWYTNESYFVNNGETMVISNDLILENSNLIVNGSDINITVGNSVYNKRGEIFIGGNLILVDSNIINYGLVSVAGGVILNGNSTIIGTGIII